MGRTLVKLGILTSRSIPNFQDLQMVELEEFKYGGTNITGYRLVDPSSPDVRKVVADWDRNRDNRRGQNSAVRQGSMIKANVKQDSIKVP